MIKIGDHVVCREIDGTGVLINVDTGFYYSLNDVGCFVLKSIGERAAFDDILAAVVDHYDIAETDAHEHLRGFLDDLAKEGIIGA